MCKENKGYKFTIVAIKEGVVYPINLTDTQTMLFNNMCLPMLCTDGESINVLGKCPIGTTEKLAEGIEKLKEEG